MKNENLDKNISKGVTDFLNRFMKGRVAWFKNLLQESISKGVTDYLKAIDWRPNEKK
jgi:hypothetical protein